MLTKEEIIQRSNFQFHTFNFNLTAIGGLFAFALNPLHDFKYVLSIIPFISFILFTFWLHQAFAIVSTKSSESKEYYNPLRKITFFIAIFSNFIIAPSASLILSWYYNYFTRMPYLIINIINVILMTFSLILFVVWFKYQYKQKYLNIE